MAKYDGIDFTPPKGVIEQAKIALKIPDDEKGDGLEPETVSVAKDVANGKAISPAQAEQGYKWWARNERFLEAEEGTPAYTAAKFWFWKQGRDWYNSLWEQMENSDKSTASNSIKKQGKEWCVYGESGRKMGCYSSKSEADKRLKQIERFSGNSAIVTVTNAVDASKIHEVEDEYGDTIIIVPSYTLPDNVVMNGGFYPADEIEASYMTLEGTPAPLAHPVTKSGDFISASSEIGVHNFQCGVFNGNVKRENGRVYVEKRINKRVAMESDRGKRVLDRIEAFMKGEGDPIHTSTGIFLEMEELDQPVANEAGEEYTWIARNMMFDHDAILLDEQGAATPDKGVGMMVNSKLHTNLDSQDQIDLAQVVKDDLDGELIDHDDTRLVYKSDGSYYAHNHKDGQLFGQAELLHKPSVLESIANWFGSICGNSSDQLQSNQYGHGGHILNALQEGNDMSFRQKLIDQLKANKVELDYENVTDEQLLESVNQTATNEADKDTKANSDVGGGTKADADVGGGSYNDLEQAIANAVKPLKDDLESVKTQLNAKEEDEMKAMRSYLKENGDYEDGEVDDMGNKAVKAAYKRMKGNSQEVPAYHLSGGEFKPNSQDKPALFTEVPNVEVN